MAQMQPLIRSKRFTLMCRDHEAATFTWNVLERRVVGRIEVADAAYLPWGAQGPDGHTNRSLLARWMRSRAIPSLRPNVAKRLHAIGIDDAATLLALGSGASLSDQYWLREEGQWRAWEQVSFFTNDFDQRLGQYLTAQDSESTGRLAGEVAKNLGIAVVTPDSSLGGNLPKRWEIRDGQRVLVKRSSSAYGQEPMNELIASELCRRLGIVHVAYTAETDGVTWESVCPCMVDDRTELVSAWHVACGCKKRNDESLATWYVRACADHGIDVARSVEQMLVADHIVCNWDRHWSNFGVLADSESREWLSAAPLFDMGESLWCDRTPMQGFGGYVAPKEGGARPFMFKLDKQLGRYCRDLSWFDAHVLEGFGGYVVEQLLQLRFLTVFEGRAEAIGKQVEARIAQVTKQANALARERMKATLVV